MKAFAAKSRKASQLRQRRHTLVRKFKLPEDLIGGSFGLSHRKCGKSNCHCANGKGHGRWTVSASFGGKRRVERVPNEWCESIEQAYLTTQSYLEALKEVMAINLELLALSRDEYQQKKQKYVVRKKCKKTAKNG